MTEIHLLLPRYGTGLAVFLFGLSIALIVSVFLDRNRVRKSLVLLLLFGLMFAEMILVMSLQLGGLVNLFLLFWVIGHFWLMGRFDR